MTKVLVNRKGSHGKINPRELLFVLLFLIWPTAQFLVFYVGVNFNSFLMAFQSFGLDANGMREVTTSFSAFMENWDWVWQFLKSKDFWSMFGMSMLSWAVSLCIGTPLGLLFSYYIARKMPGASFFRVILYLPSIISELILVLIYTNFMDFPFSENVLHSLSGLTNVDNPLWVRLLVIYFFTTWFSFGNSALMYSNAMSGISPEVIEACHLDGATGMKEFRRIVFPLVFPTFKVFFVASIASIFTNQVSLYSIYGSSCPTDMRTIGYYLFASLRSEGYAFYPKLALLGIIFSLVAIPLTILAQKLLNRFGPSED